MAQLFKDPSEHDMLHEFNNTLKTDNLHTEIYDIKDNGDFPYVNFPFLQGDIPEATSYGIYSAQLVRVACICNIKCHTLMNAINS